MFSVGYTERDFSTAFRVTETNRTHLGGQSGGGVGFCVLVVMLEV